MASSKRRPNHARRFMALAIFILFAIAAYTAGWFYLARQVEIRVDAAIERARNTGMGVECAGRSVRGYPFRLGLYCESTAFAEADEGASFSAGAFRSAAQVYDPLFLVGELDAPARLELEGIPPLALRWEIMRASVRLASPLPERVSVESRDLSVAAQEGGDETSLATIQTIEAHMRPNAGDLDLALRFEGLVLDPALVQGRTIPPVAGVADLVVADGVALATAGERSLRGRSGTIRNARLSAEDASLALSGPFSIDAEGLLDADLQLSVENPEELSAILSQALPELADQAEALFSGLAAMGDTPTLPLTIEDGRVSLAFLDLGQIPPL
jgi:hypothetical protein